MTADPNGTPFAIVRRGYDRAQVEERLNRLLADRDAATAAGQDAVAEREQISRELDVSRSETRGARSELAENRAEVDRLAGQVAELSVIPHTVDGMSDRLQQMVRVAQDEVNDMRARATRGAAQILSMAQAEADELRESSHQERRTFESEQRGAQEELRTRLEETRAQLATLREEADGQRARLDAELADRRSRDDQTLAAELADRREVMLADLATQERRQREEAQRIVDAASARSRVLLEEAAAETDRSRSHAREQVVRANEELDQMRALQRQVAEQLAGVRSLLDWTLPRISSTAGAPHGESTVPGVSPVSLPSSGSSSADGPAANGESTLDASSMTTPAREAHTFGGGDRDDRAFSGRQLFDDRGLDTPLFGATAAAVDDSATGRRRGDDDRPEPVVEERTDDHAPDPTDDGAEDQAEDRADEHARVEPAGDETIATEPATGESGVAEEPAESTPAGGTRLPYPRGADRAEASRPSPVARAGARR